MIPDVTPGLAMVLLPDAMIVLGMWAAIVAVVSAWRRA